MNIEILTLEQLKAIIPNIKHIKRKQVYHDFKDKSESHTVYHPDFLRGMACGFNWVAEKFKTENNADYHHWLEVAKKYLNDIFDWIDAHDHADPLGNGLVLPGISLGALLKNEKQGWNETSYNENRGRVIDMYTAELLIAIERAIAGTGTEIVMFDRSIMRGM